MQGTCRRTTVRCGCNKPTCWSTDVPACAVYSTVCVQSIARAHTHTHTRSYSLKMRASKACVRACVYKWMRAEHVVPLPVDALIMLHHTAYPAPRSLASTVAKVRPSSIVVKPRTFSNKKAFGCVSVMIRTRWKNRSPVPFSPRPLDPRTPRYTAQNARGETRGGAF